jgi:hypothetical protein
MEDATTGHNANDLFYSDAETENLLHIKNEFEKEFPVGTMFPARRQLIDAMRKKASQFGFFVIDRGFSVLCFETTARDMENNRRQKACEELSRENGKIYVPRKVAKSKCGCEFKASFVQKRGTTQDEFRISKVQYMHGKGCRPSGEQYKAAWRSGGHASKHIARTKNLKLHTIVQLLASGQKPSTKTMRAMLCDMLPKGFDVSSKFINNMKAKVRAKISDGEFDTLLSQGTVSNEEADFILGDDLPPEYLSIAEEIASDTLKDALSDPGTKCLVVHYLCQLHRKDPSFLFDIQRDENDTIVGICWQTATMRLDWDTCACCISLDGMKRQLNNFSYPYIAVTSLDGYGNMVVCAEAIVVSERIEAYAWLLRCCNNFSCNRKLDGLRVIYGDGLVTCESLLVSLGIKDSCSLLDDVHHLLSADCGTWYKQFGVEKWNYYGGMLRALVHESYTLEAYEKTRSLILATMESRDEPQSLNNYFNNVIHAGRHRFARYSVCATPCNEELLGSSVAESNHASYVARIGGGSWDDPAMQVKDCIQRMSELSNKRARLRDQYRRQSAANIHTASDEQIKAMLLKLSKRGFKICEEQYRKSSEYYCVHPPSGTSSEHRDAEMVEVIWQGKSPKSPRIIDGRKCSCNVFIAYQVQCRHLFAYHKRSFQLNLVHPKFHAQTLSVSAPNSEFTHLLSKWVIDRDTYIGSIGDRLELGELGLDGAILNGESATEHSISDDVDNEDKENDVDSSGEESNSDTARERTMEGMPHNSKSIMKRNVTYRDFTDVANSVANLALSLPNEDLRRECLGVLVRMRDALSMSASSGNQQSVPLVGFMSSADAFLAAFGPNAESRREGVFAPLAGGDPGNNFEMQRHNFGKVRHKRLTSLSERNAMASKIADARNRPPQCSFCSSTQHTIKRCSVMDKAAFVGKKNSVGWNQWYRTLGNQNCHEVVLPSAGNALKLARELQDSLPSPSHIIRHLSIRSVHFSNEAVEYISRPTSIYRHKNSEHSQIPSPDSNIVGVQLIERGGNFWRKDNERSDVNTTVYVRARTVQKWMEKAFSDSQLFVYVKQKEL